MKRTKYIIIASFCFFAALFFCENLFRAPVEKTCEKSISEINEIYGQLISEFAKKMKQKYQLEILGTARGGLGAINFLFLDIKSEEFLDLDEVRPLIVNCIKDFLNELNSNNEMKNILYNRPTKAKHILLFFRFYKNHENPPAGKIASARVENGEILYRTYNHNSQRHQACFSETFEDATKKVEAIQQPKIGQQPPSIEK